MNSSPFLTIVNILTLFGLLGLAVQAFIGLSFLISSVWEKERRATIFAAVQFTVMAAILIIFLVLVGLGFFQTSPGMVLLIGVEDFCKFCKKCAVCCPSQSIPQDDEPKEFNGTLKWKLNDETCFGYWAKAGTDCCICMKVCPWSHARTFPHRLIVWLITRNKYAGKIFSVMDDIFYGRTPKPNIAPKWARFKSWEMD